MDKQTKKQTWEIIIKSRWGEEKKVLHELDSRLAAGLYREEDCFELKTAVAEACLNSIEHGNGLDPRLSVEVKVFVITDTICVEVWDHGLGFNKVPPMPDHKQDRGRGLWIINNMVDEWSCCYDQGRNTFGLKMVKKMRKRNEGNL